MSQGGQAYQKSRPGRVKVEYRTDVNGKMKMVELPFVMGVLADLSGNAGPEKADLADANQRRFEDVTSDRLDAYVAKVAPRVQFRVANELSGKDEELFIDLSFSSIDDFSPDAIARRFAPLRELFEMRESLRQLLTKMGGKPEMEKAIATLLRDVDAERSKTSDGTPQS